MRILVIEDDEKVANFIKKGLQEEQYAVDVSYDGEDGAHWAIQNEYDLIILDIMLPIKDGIEVCKEIRDNSVSTPILMLTAVADHVSSTRYSHYNGMAMEADDYLPKPATAEDITESVKSLLNI